MSKFLDFGIGWLKTSEKGNDFISVVTASKDKDVFENINPKTKAKTTTKLWLQEDGKEPVPVNSFCIFPTSKEPGSKGPDYKLTFITKE